MKPAAVRRETAAKPVPATMLPMMNCRGLDMTMELTLPRELFADAPAPVRAAAPLRRADLQPDVETWVFGPGVDVHLPLARPARPLQALLPPRHREHGHRLGLALEADWR